MIKAIITIPVKQKLELLYLNAGAIRDMTFLDYILLFVQIRFK